MQFARFEDLPPEVQGMVAKYLSRCDLRTGALVSKAWYTFFNASLWSTFEINKLPPPPSPSPCPTVDCQVHRRCAREHAIRLHGHLIRRLSIVPTSMDAQPQALISLLASSCQSLSSLTFFNSHWFPAESIKALVAVNSAIRVLSTDSCGCLQQAVVTLAARLQVLKVRVSMSTGDITRVLTSFPNLQELSLDYLTVKSTLKEVQPTGRCSSQHTYKLKRLNLLRGGYYRTFDSILKKCPSLEHLALGSLKKMNAKAITNTLCLSLVRLSSLEFDCIEPGTVSTVCDVLLAIPNGQLRSVTMSNPRSNILETLGKYHGLGLERLRLYDVRDSEYSGYIHIFTGCVRLKRLKIQTKHLSQAVYIDIRSIIGQAWVCLDLEELAMPLRLVHPCQSAHLIDQAQDEKEELAPGDYEPKQVEMVFMRRLGSLPKLRSLDLHNSCDRFNYQLQADLGPPQDMLWRLQCGLNLLSGLRRLRYIHLGHRQFCLNVAELEWIKKHWKSLEKLTCYDIRSTEKRAWFAHHWPSLQVKELAHPL